MFVLLQIRNDDNLRKKIKKIYNAKLKKWQHAGAKGLKPKLVDTTTEIVQRGISCFVDEQHPQDKTRKARRQGQ